MACRALLVVAAVCGTALLAGCSTQTPSKPAKLNPSVKEAVRRGEKLLNDGKKDKAIEAFSQAIKLDPHCKQAYVWRAVARSETGKPQQAVDDYSKAIEIDPNDAYVYDQRSLIYRNVLHDRAKADADKDKAYQLREKQRDVVREQKNAAQKKK